MRDLLADDIIYLTHTGSETDLIFNRGIDLPHFSLFPKLDTEDGRALIRGYAEAQIAIAAQYGMGAIVETATWKANPDRAAALGYGSDDLDRVNRASVAAIADVVQRARCPVLVSGNIGPRGDAYTAETRMDVAQARRYHRPQSEGLAAADVDLITGSTLTSIEEAAGIALAAQDVGLASVISFTVETDGRLPDGSSLSDAVAQVDALTDASPAHYMVNCAHPDHFAHILDGKDWMARLKGMVVNASRCSHAELDNAEVLDEGNPPELAAQLSAFLRQHPSLQVVGGCCGTSARHLQEIGKAVSARG